ncbi:MAG: prepilin-type N-terminal cleavage/methylation domain-containing protein [Candidatus Hydrogenedens sp.]|nr:prepilin-type N-terminal cleavage/methylation domain-containing protein [Candidatus Hydrogenedens sp.]
MHQGNVSSQAGYSLIELMIATAILMVVSSLSIIVIRSSAESNVMSSAKERVDSDLRSTMLALTTEVRQAYSERTVDSEPPMAPEEAFGVQVTNGGKQLRFTVPRRSETSPVPMASSPIVIQFQNEDTNANNVLDSGEDQNGDGVLTRRLVRVENGNTEVLGSANTISDVRFTLEKGPAANVDTKNVLVVELDGSAAYGAGDTRKHVAATLESRIHLEN